MMEGVSVLVLDFRRANFMELLSTHDVSTSETGKSKVKSEEKNLLEECIYCGKLFPKKDMPRHKADEEKTLECLYCDTKFTSLRIFRRHMYRYHKLYTCKICNAKFLKGAYEYHMRSLHRNRPECKLCAKSFATHLSLIAHQKKIHMGERDNRWKCLVCSYQAPDKYQWAVHEARHRKSPALICEHCGVGHYTRGELKKHIQAEHSGGFSCDICRKSFRSKEYVRRHRITHNSHRDATKANFTCEECGKGFVKSSSFKRHILKHRGELPGFKCEVCGKVLATKSTFASHLKMHTEENKGAKRRRGRPPKQDPGGPVSCDLCEESLPSHDRCLDHKSYAHNILINCPKCPKTFKCALYLNKHIARHEETNDKQLKWCCPQCAQKYKMKKHLQEHGIKDHKQSFSLCIPCHLTFSSRKEFKKHLSVGCKNLMECDTCSYVTNMKASMMGHVRRHIKNFSFFCDTCRRGFYNKCELEGHMRSHTEEATPCEACGKLYTNMKSFYKHRMRQHPTLYPVLFLCPSCKYSTKNKETFERHKESHMIARHVCEMCGKSLCSVTALNAHRRIHTGEKPFSCEICDKRFSRKSYLKSHKASHKNGALYRCVRCLIEFQLRSQYIMHVKTCSAKSNNGP